MQIAGADTAERNAHNGITRSLQLGFWLVNQLELAGGYVGVSFHCYIMQIYAFVSRFDLTKINALWRHCRVVLSYYQMYHQEYISMSIL